MKVVEYDDGGSSEEGAVQVDLEVIEHSWDDVVVAEAAPSSGNWLLRVRPRQAELLESVYWAAVESHLLEW